MADTFLKTYAIKGAGVPVNTDIFVTPEGQFTATIAAISKTFSANMLGLLTEQIEAAARQYRLTQYVDYPVTYGYVDENGETVYGHGTFVGPGAAGIGIQVKNDATQEIHTTVEVYQRLTPAQVDEYFELVADVTAANAAVAAFKDLYRIDVARLFS